MPTQTNQTDDIITMDCVPLSVDSDASSSDGDTNSNYGQCLEGFTSTTARPLLPGTYVPTPAFFDPTTDDLDLPLIGRHTVRLAEAGVQGILTQGSNGEAVHLSHLERRLVTAATRGALDRAGFTHIPIIVGCGAQSTRETVELCHDAMVSGGDYAMILPPSYYRTLYTPESQFEFFTNVANRSPIPIFIYNFPGAVSGIDLDSDVLTKLSRHPNIVGAKLTCGNTGKLIRLASSAPASFMTFGGSADFTLQTLIAGGQGVIGGLANISPRSCVELYNLSTSGRFSLAQKMQAIVARGDWVAIKGGVVSTKSCLNSYFQYGGYARTPLPRPTPSQEAQVKDEFEELLLLEHFLSSARREKDIHFDKKKEFPQLVELEYALTMAVEA